MAALVVQVTSLGAKPDDLTAVHTAFDRFWATVDDTLARPPSTVWRLHFSTAVAEIIANVMRHAYGESTGTIQLRLRCFSDRVEALIVDQGAPFIGFRRAHRAVRRGGELPEGGRGLAIVREAVDRLEYARTAGGVNRWRLIKRLAVTG